jgi:hypothetical protein
MARHEGKDEKLLLEHARKAAHPKRVMRKGGGEIDGGPAEDEDEEAHKEAEEAEHKRALGGALPHHRGKKGGGTVKGEKPKSRPDRRARGGATSDMNPESSAGKMSMLPYERVGPKPDGGGEGKDRD